MQLINRILLICLVCLPSISFAKTFEHERAKAIEALSKNLVTHEINNIHFRREVFGRPGLNLYVVFISNKGQPFDYFVTDGKCSSSKKHLISKQAFKEGQRGIDSDGYSVYGDFVLKKAGVDGTYGSSTPYVYCKTTDGKYKQWNGRTYISDAPLELSIQPLLSKHQD